MIAKPSAGSVHRAILGTLCRQLQAPESDETKLGDHNFMYAITPEMPEDDFEVENLYDLTFAPGRKALSSYRLRDGVAALEGLCFVARDADGILAGAIRQWPVRIGEKHRASLIGPIAVHQTRQGEGLGAMLIARALDSAQDAGWPVAILIGDAPYYARFGFEQVADQGITFPPPTNPGRILARALGSNDLSAITGEVRKWDALL
jgi:predicted N-acetyltransferase YhbS